MCLMADSVTFSIRAPRVEVEWWRGVAVREGLSVTALVRRAVREECNLLDALWREKHDV